jgi:PAS domain S-box-containing protein
MENGIRILHLEDNTADAQLIQLLLERANIKFEYFVTDNEKDYIFHLRNQKTDIILSDYALPGYSGKVALLFAKNNYPQIPFIFVSGTMGEDAAIDSLLNGATDYVLKTRLERLVPAVMRAFNEMQEHKARERVEKELQKLSHAVEQSPNSVYITDINGKIEYVNPAAIKLSGYTAEDLIGKNHRTLCCGEIPKEDYLLLWEQVNSGKVWKGEFFNKKKYGERYWESVSISPILDNNGIITYFVTIKEDISERKKLTIELVAAKEKAEESDRLKTAFLHNISHEIRTPLNAIVGFSEFLNEPDLNPEMRKQFTDIIIQNSDQLLTIISAIISIAAVEAGQEKIAETEINLNSTLKHIHEHFSPFAEKQKISFNLIPFLPYEDRIVSDETKLVQVLNNLIGNALKFTKHGHVNFGYRVNANELEFFVEDTGIGIEPEMHEEIFKRFRQVESTIARQYGGSGLGLSISKAYVELLGGNMWLISELGIGSTFLFTIPYVRAKKNNTSARLSNNMSGIAINESKTILVAEDEDSNFKLMEALLLNLNINIVRANTGIEAIETCRSKHIDVVLMDIQMPLMDGYEATRQIREFMPTLPIIAQTAYATSKDKHFAMACGCTDFISKPFKKELFISKVKEQLNKM